MKEKLLKFLDEIAENFCAVSLIIMLILLSIQVIQRYVFNASNTWSEEFSRYLFIWVLYVGTSYTFKTKGHVTLDVITDAYPPKVRQVVIKIGHILVFAFCVLITVLGIQYCIQYAIQKQVSLSLKIPMWVVYASIPAGFGLSALRNLISVFKKEEE